MPYPGVPESLTPKMERCVKDVMEKDGKDKSSAIAICHESIMRGKEFILSNGFILDAGVLKEIDHEELTVTKEDDGRYKIVTISTAAVEDLTKETFDAASIDYDAKMAEVTGEYPEFRLFHKEALAIGRVENMRRVGIFAVDEGHSYTDPFSLEVCEKMLARNDGRWRVSRGFWVIEASGGCPSCGSKLVVRQKHMVVGFACPVCKNVYAAYKGVLKDLHFRKTKTFDVTITDHPCVPYTGVSAIKISSSEGIMSKEELMAKLLAGGVSKEIAEAKLATLTDAQLKEYDGIPEATLLKEFEQPEPEAPTTNAADGEQTFVLDESVLTAFAGVAKEVLAPMLKEALDGLTVDVSDSTVQLKELPEVVERLDRIEKMLTTLATADAERFKQLTEAAPRNAGLRVMRMKAADPAPAKDEEDEELDDNGMPMKKKSGKVCTTKELEQGVLLGSDGRVFSSATEFVMGGKK